jgi:hypothetical protein
LVSFRASDLAWARRLVLGLGSEVSVVSPPQLVAAVRQEARAALAIYEDGGPPLGWGSRPTDGPMPPGQRGAGQEVG